MQPLIKDLDECIQLLSDDKVGALDAKLREMRNTLYLDLGNWDAIHQAAMESPWIPPQYFVNDWVSDICSFLREDNYAEKHNA